MFKKQWLVVVVLVVGVFSLSIYGCGEDDPAGPGGGGGSGGGAQLAAGTFNTTLAIWECGMTDTLKISLEQVLCSDFTFDELFELDCPVNITNNSFSVDCTSMEDNGFCSYTERIQLEGVKVGDTWTITGSIMVSDENPANCSFDPACSNVILVVEMVGGVPSACTYAEANTIEATIVGGPLAGSTDFETDGFGSGSGGIFSWNFFGFAGVDGGIVLTQRASSFNFANISVNLVDIDINSLPATFSVTVTGAVFSSGALPTGFASYYDQTTAGDFFFGDSGTGSITVNEVSDTHIAGTINSLSISGMTSPSGGGTPTPDTRSLSGGFHVRANGFADASALRKGWVGRILSK